MQIQMRVHEQAEQMCCSTSSMLHHQILLKILHVNHSQTTTVSLLHHVIGDSHGVQTDTVLSVNQVSERPCVIHELSYGKQIARQLRTQYANGIHDNPMTLKSRLTVTQDHWKRNH